MAIGTPDPARLSKTATSKKKAPAKKAAPKKPPGKAIAVADKGDFTPAKAKAITKKITEGAAATVNLIVQAYNGRIWLAMGYKSWDEYRDKEFGGAPLALPVVQRRAAVAQMAKAEMSSRAIASMTGTDQSTIVRDINSAKKDEPDQPMQDASVDDGEEIHDAELVDPPEDEPQSRTVTGLDGKKREVSTAPKEPTVVNIVSEARGIARDLEKIRVRLGELYDREDYEENKVDVDTVLQQSIDDFADEVGDRLTVALEGEEGTLHTDPEPAAVG